MASILVLELHHPVMSTLWKHRDRSKRRKKKIKFTLAVVKK